MRRREFITLLGGAAATWPRAARAQQSGPMPAIGFLGVAPASSYVSRVEGLRSGLRELGYVEGRNVSFAFQWADTPAQLSELAAELVKREVAVIVTSGNTATRAAKTATSNIPIVFSAADDPEDIRGEQATARAIGQRILVLDASTAAEIEQAFAAIARERADALLVNADALFTAQRELLVALAARYRMPAIYAWREFAEAGGLMSYGTMNRSYHQMGTYVGRILKGEKPADLPVMQPINFELIINLRTLKSLGLDVPDRLLALADEVIELSQRDR
jgi:putative tryptophan/tyrosine transport system substrate-binding protein